VPRKLNAVDERRPNEFPGTVYELLRNALMDANAFFTESLGTQVVLKPPFKPQSIWGPAGGEISPTNSFIFGSYEGCAIAPARTTGHGAHSPCEKRDFSLWHGFIYIRTAPRPAALRHSVSAIRCHGMLQPQSHH